MVGRLPLPSLVKGLDEGGMGKKRPMHHGGVRRTLVLAYVYEMGMPCNWAQLYGGGEIGVCVVGEKSIVEFGEPFPEIIRDVRPEYQFSTGSLYEELIWVTK